MKKTWTLILILSVLLGCLTLGSVAAETPDSPAPPTVLPGDINGEETYAVKTVVDFDDEDVLETVSLTQAERCTWELVDGISGKGIKLINNANTCEVNVALTPDEGNEDNAQDWSGFDGLLYWVDMRGVTYNIKDGAEVLAGVGMRIYSVYGSGYSWTRNTTEPVLPDFKINAYYQNEEGEWTLCDQTKMNGERVVFPVDYVGWVYVPFTSYITTKGSTGGPEAGIYGDFAISKLGILSGPYATKEPGISSLIVDEVQLVKLGVTQEELDASQTSPPESDESSTPTTNPPKPTNPPESEEKTDRPTCPAHTEPGTTTPADTAEEGCSSSLTLSSAWILLAGACGAALTLFQKRR